MKIKKSNWKKIITKLETGEIRSAEKSSNGEWIANKKAKQAILDAFKFGKIKSFGDKYYSSLDKDTLPPRNFSLESKIRIVPGGTSVRRGSYIAQNVVIMPPSFVNIGAYIDEGTMVDSNVCIGSCAQIGKNVHLSAGVQIGGVLEPVGQTPVIIEDNVFVGAGSIIVEGIVVRKNAVIAAGVVISKSTLIYDCVNKKILRAGSDIPERAVVVPGTRQISNEWGRQNNLGVMCPIIIKYRDSKTETSLMFEEFLR